MASKQRQKKLIFTDSFKYLNEAAKSVVNLSAKVTNILNRLLPGRILSQANIFNITIDVAQDLAKMILLHVEDSLIEQNILIAQKELSVRGLGTLSGHNATRPISATGIVKIKLNELASTLSPSLIFNKTEFICNENNLKYVMIDDVAIYSSSANNIYLKIIEGSFVENTFIALGEKLETIHLDSVYPIEHYNFTVRVNGELWKKADSLYDMPAESHTYLIKNGISNQVDVVFGDDVYGKKLTQGDTVQIEFLNTNGESGNISENSTFKLTSGLYDTNGGSIDINEFATITVESGFTLGSNGENIEVTRSIAGYNSRAMVFTRPENIKAYLSRLSILSYIEAWSDLDSNVFNILLAPNISKRLTTYSDYLTIPENQLILSENEKNSILEYINTSGHQSTSTEILLHDPVFSKYIVFCYVNGQILDRLSIKEAIKNAISKVFLEKTLLDMSSITEEIITINLLENEVLSSTGLLQCSISMISEENELARINGKYTKKSTKIVGNVLKTTSEVVKIDKLDSNTDILKIDELINKIGGGTTKGGTTKGGSTTVVGSVTGGGLATNVGSTNNVIVIPPDIRDKLAESYENSLKDLLASQNETITVVKNPNLGFDELGGISVDDLSKIPLLRGGFLKYDKNGNHVFLDEPIYIFYKTENGFEEL